MKMMESLRWARSVERKEAKKENARNTDNRTSSENFYGGKWFCFGKFVYHLWIMGSDSLIYDEYLQNEKNFTVQYQHKLPFVCAIKNGSFLRHVLHNILTFPFFFFYG